MWSPMDSLTLHYNGDGNLDFLTRAASKEQPFFVIERQFRHVQLPKFHHLLYEH